MSVFPKRLTQHCQGIPARQSSTSHTEACLTILSSTNTTRWALWKDIFTQYFVPGRLDICPKKIHFVRQQNYAKNTHCDICWFSTKVRNYIKFCVIFPKNMPFWKNFRDRRSRQIIILIPGFAVMRWALWEERNNRERAPVEMLHLWVEWEGKEVQATSQLCSDLRGKKKGLLHVQKRRFFIA